MDLMWYQCYLFADNPNKQDTQGLLVIADFQGHVTEHADFVCEVLLTQRPLKGESICHLSIPKGVFSVYEKQAYEIGRLAWSARDRRYYLWGRFWEGGLF